MGFISQIKGQEQPRRCEISGCRDGKFSGAVFRVWLAQFRYFIKDSRRRKNHKEVACHHPSSQYQNYRMLDPMDNLW
ncbi:conserved hypothetical protein [delta proteobacterium NaphS2]|nr:conserved hypothetical protein [delta proteobacterium NaphS2]